MILGITGGSGCGKTTALKAVQDLGGLVLDCDAIYHELLACSPALLAAIGARFPGAVSGSELDRKKLGRLVFSDEKALLGLNRITHRAVKEEVLGRLAHNTSPLAAIDAIALFEGGLAELCQYTVAITAPWEDRISRLMAREGISRDYAEARLRAQHDSRYFQNLCDFTLENCGTKAAFYEKARALFAQLLAPAAHPHANPKLIIYRRTIMSNETLRETLLFQPKHGYDRLTPAQKAEMESYCKDYAAFMDAAKTEREAVTYTVAAAEKAGFRPLVPGMSLKAGDKVYRNNRGKSILLAVIGEESLNTGMNICAAHIDSPRLDIKPNPLYEDSEIAYLKTHYYGGIKKYQWTTVPLALHGVIYKKNGEVITVTMGEKDTDPVLCVSDLLIHLSGDQMKKTLAEGITGEQLNVILGTIPMPDDDGADRVKLAVLNLLHETYGIVEEDFLSAELTIVPAGKCREVGLDRSLLGAYGHDDRVCSYAALAPMLTMGTPAKTAVCVLADKEEIGSVGVSGMQSYCFETFVRDLCDSQGASLDRCFENAFCLSADVTNAFDPNFAETCDKRNNSRLNYGVGICKYTGSRGKGGASDASAEAMGYVRTLFENAGVVWQTATLGKVDQGGGGTVAAYMANRNIVTVDAGVPVLCMHAPWELVSKFDTYMTMKAMTAVYAGK